MITTNASASRARVDDGKRNVVTTSSMKPRPARAVRSIFPGVNKRETQKVEPGMRFTTENLDKLQRAKARQARLAQVAQATPAPDALKGAPKAAVTIDESAGPGAAAWMDKQFKADAAKAPKTRKGGRAKKAKA